MDMMLSRALYIWGKKSPDNKAKIEEWVETSIILLAEGKGKELASTTSDGISVSFSSAGLTNIEWLKILTQALSYFDKAPSNRATAIFI